MKKIIIGFLSLLVLSACTNNKYTYPQNKDISQKDGAIIDTAKGFILQGIIFDKQTHTLDWNKSRLDELNNILLKTNEPVLSNFYQDRNIYRLIIKESDKKPIILAVNKDEDKAWIIAKTNILEKDSISLNESTGSISDAAPAEELLLKANFDIISKELKENQILTFDSLFQKTNFFELPIGEVNNTYPNYFLLEAHQSGEYWYIYRPVNDEGLKEVVDYMKHLGRIED